MHSNEDPAQPKINIFYLKKKNDPVILLKVKFSADSEWRKIHLESIVFIGDAWASAGTDRETVKVHFRAKMRR